ncbi:DUF4169 family protein [Ancylobacter sp. 6x-1]|uniref:DUF4169 family protein n=1 Tax=Ancylobacter crimeensis TaxID=2579147 RepID=A0ABT0DEA6_9HYPH|nr:DUF4169 family protein [Ancylobacter crimeensis]MCK0198276.1 DUF4169 family protein [Ancylobacter crimeensis]
MSEIINLRRHRKKIEKQAAEQSAAGNRYRFGRSKKEREAEALREEQRMRLLEGHKRMQGDET